MARRRKALPGKVDELNGRIENWRQTREKKTAMPEELWFEATALAREQGVYRISQALSVNFTNLRKRVERVNEARADRSRSSGFLEVDPQQFNTPCGINGVDPFDYLTEVQRHADAGGKNPADWMPWNYRRTLQRLHEESG